MVPFQRDQVGKDTSPSRYADPPHISVSELDRMVDEASNRPYFRSIRTEPASQVNLEFPRDWDPLPYRADTKTTTVRLTRQSEEEFVRVHGPTNQPGQWIMRKEDLFDSNGRQLSPKELYQKFSLPIVPTEISDVALPNGTEIRIGIVSPRKGEPDGKTVQYDLMQKPPREWFKNRRVLDQ